MAQKSMTENNRVNTSSDLLYPGHMHISLKIVDTTVDSNIFPFYVNQF